MNSSLHVNCNAHLGSQEGLNQSQRNMKITASDVAGGAAIQLACMQVQLNQAHWSLYAIEVQEPESFDLLRMNISVRGCIQPRLVIAPSSIPFGIRIITRSGSCT